MKDDNVNDEDCDDILDCDAAAVDNVVGDVRGLILQNVVDDDDGNDDCCRDALMHAREEASKDDKETIVGRVVMNKGVYEDVDVDGENVVEDDVVEDVDVNEEIQVLDLDVLQVGDVLKVGDGDGQASLNT